MRTFIPRDRRKYLRGVTKRMSLKVMKLYIGYIVCFIGNWETVTENYLRIVVIADV